MTHFPRDGTADACATGAEGQERRTGRRHARVEGTPRRPKPAAYLVFRDGRRIARTNRRSYTDTRAKPGRHRYVVEAVDAKGRRGAPSRALRARMPGPKPLPGATPSAPFAPAAPAGPGPPPAPPGSPSAVLTAAMVDRLFWRAGFGPTPAQRDAWTGRQHLELVDWLLDTPPSLAPTDTPPLTGGTGNQPIDPLASEDELVMEWLDRMQRAVNPLPERIAFFWHRHWAVSRDDGIPAPWLVAYRNRLLRFADAAQSFRALAYEMTTLDAAMSMYLNGNQNVKGRPNENYARELMELFCLGPKAPDGTDNYSQADVEGLAQALTGWRLNSDQLEPRLRQDHLQPRALRARRQDLPRPGHPGARPRGGGVRRPGVRQRGARRRSRAPEPRAVPDPQAVERVHRDPDPRRRAGRAARRVPPGRPAPARVARASSATR